MSRRKQTNPRAIKRDVSKDEDDNSIPAAKKIATESIRSDSIDSIMTTEDEQKNSSLKCDTCQELFLTSELFNQHRLYQCSFLTEETNSDESRTSSYDEYANQIDKIPYGTNQNEDYPHQCSYCNKSFANMALLLKHEQVHVELMPFRCTFCGKGFKHRRSLNRHSKLHTGERKFKCTSCESTFARSDHLKAHIRTHNNNNHNNNHNHNNFASINVDFQIKSSLNTKVNFEERRLSSDNKNNKDENKTEHCPYCPRICLGEDSLRYHIQTEHNQTLEKASNSNQSSSESISPALSDTYCHLCNAKFNNRENYYAHIRCTHPPFHNQLDQISLFQIPSLKKQQDVNDHSTLNEYAIIEKIIWCEKCKRSFESMTVYLQHYSIQHCLQIIKCLQCQDIFETIELFFNHIERIHPSKTVETFKCKLCNATYNNRTDFLHHVEAIHKSCSYPCSLCPCQLNSTDELLDHLKFVHKINNNIDFHMNHHRPSFNTLFSCGFCTKKFNSRFELNQHILNDHNDEQHDVKSDWQPNEKKSTTPSSTDIICSLCDLTFSSESLLLEHNKHTHRSSFISSITPSFKCTYCHALFTSRAQLDRHSRIHIASSGNNLKCNICDRLFSTIDILSEHKLSHCKAITSNICSFCHQTLNSQDDYINHLHEHNHQYNLKTKAKLFTNNNDNVPLAITCIVCKQSLINEREVNLHAKFHLTNITNKKSSKIILTKESSLETMTIQCNQCHQSTNTNRDFLLELPSFNINCFNCIEKDLKSKDPPMVPDIDSTSTSLCCPKCQHDVQFDSIKTYQQHFTSLHLPKYSVEEYHCLKCNKIVPSREHILQHHKKKSLLTSGFLIDSIDSSLSSHLSSLPSVHYCYLCRTNFNTAIKMHIHLIEHQYPNHEYQCSLCDQSKFDDAAKLYHHMVQHGSKARLHPCRQCDVYFMFSMHLINHQYSHTDETSVLKTNGSTSIGTKLSIKSKFINNEDKKQSNDDDDISCKSIMTRSSTKGACRSVVVS
ncbi:unnamed protein product [Rotaria magnacalcarata]|uniref:C2H2-type domain-containing protein n=1 Tax=Rotaria magnacalcarata TaxID=392030 RepID=A0A816Z8I9_9BILA|nr:unnamed protein product [Rotaria magnacalcarata]